MILEGEVNWILVLAVLAAAGVALGLFGLWGGAVAGSRLARASSERDQAKAAAETAERRLFEMLNAIPVALVETDTQGRFVFANKAAHQLLGRRDAELIGLRFHSATWGITYPDGRPIPPDLLPSARALRGQTVKGFQHLLANPANRKRMLVSVTAMPIENALGEIIGSTAAVVETESLTQPAIEPAPVEPVIDTGVTRRVFDVATSALVVVDRDGRVMEANRTALDRNGAAEVAGRDFADTFIDDMARTEARQAIRAAFSAPVGEAEPFEAAGVLWRFLPLTDEAGTVDALLMAGEAAPEPAAEGETVSIVDGDADPLAATRAERDAALQALEDARAELALAQSAAADAPAPHPDLARLSALEAERDQARAERDAVETRLADETETSRREREAGRRMEDVGRLTGGVAHDFSALLGVMTTALDLMLKQAEDPAKVRRLGQAALTAGQRGEALTRRLAAFSEGDDASARRMDLGVLLRAMEPSMRASAPGVDLLIESPSAPLEALVDPVLFEGAVRALFDNAVQAASADEAAAVAVRLQPDDAGGVRLTVRDNGPGMPAAVKARASEPFVTSRPGSAGLGLAQAYAFARHAGGALTIDSQPGEGAEIAVVLPPLPSAADAAA